MDKPVDTDAIAEVFKEHGWTWKLKGRGHIVPDVDDIDMALDTIAELLYDEDPETNPQVVLGRMIVQKTRANKLDVYLYVGDFE